MPVFDFSSASKEKEAFVCTYTAFTSDSAEKTPDDPILVLDNQQKQWSHHSTGVFCNQSQWTAFEFKEEDETFRSNILRIDALHRLGEQGGDRTFLLPFGNLLCGFRIGLRLQREIGRAHV